MPEYVFPNELGGFIDSHNWRSRVFRISKGDNITDVSKQLGHCSVNLLWMFITVGSRGKRKRKKRKST